MIDILVEIQEFRIRETRHLISVDKGAARAEGFLARPAGFISAATSIAPRREAIDVSTLSSALPRPVRGRHSKKVELNASAEKVGGDMPRGSFGILCRIVFKLFSDTLSEVDLQK